MLLRGLQSATKVSFPYLLTNGVFILKAFYSFPSNISHLSVGVRDETRQQQREGDLGAPEPENLVIPVMCLDLLGGGQMVATPSAGMGLM